MDGRWSIVDGGSIMRIENENRLPADGGSTTPYQSVLSVHFSGVETEAISVTGEPLGHNNLRHTFSFNEYILMIKYKFIFL